MTPAILLRDLRARGIALRVEGDRLHGDAPRGILTAEDRAQVAAHKAELVALLRAEATPAAVVTVADVLAGFPGARVVKQFPPGGCPVCRQPAVTTGCDPFGPTMPTVACRVCKATDWFKAGSGWTCGRCHPPPHRAVNLGAKIENEGERRP